MAKKAAALQAFQKTDLAIPDTILEDAELRDETELEEHLDDRSLEGKDVEGEDARLFPAPDPILPNKLHYKSKRFDQMVSQQVSGAGPDGKVGGARELREVDTHLLQSGEALGARDHDDDVGWPGNPRVSSYPEPRNPGVPSSSSQPEPWNL